MAICRPLPAGLIALALVAAMPTARGQTAPGEPESPAAGETEAAKPHPQTPQGRQIASRVEKHIADLHQRLRITPAQEEQWRLFAQIMRENAAHSDQIKARAEAANHNAVDDLRGYAEIARTHAEDIARLVPAFSALYAAMSAEQRKAADNAFHEFERRGGR